MRNKTSKAKRSKGKPDNLFSPDRRGGVIAGKGFNFQDAFIVAAIPGWLATPGFKSFIKEGFEDVDVVFAGSTEDSIRRYQLKNHLVALSEFRTIIGDLIAAKTRTGTVPTSFVLGCCGLDRRVLALWTKIKEFRGARKTHSKAILQPTRDKLVLDCKKLKLASHADFLIDSVEIEHENPDLQDVDTSKLQERFRGAFMKLPLWRNHQSAALDRLFEGLLLRVNKAIRDGLSREDVEGLIRRELAAVTKGPAVVVHLHGWTRQAYDVPADEVVDWTQYFDHPTLRVPSPDLWASRLLPELDALRKRFDANPDRRLIWLRARAPLSAGLAFGHTFADAAGYGIRVQQTTPGAETAIQDWESDAMADASYSVSTEEVEVDPDGDALIFGVGVTDDPRPKVQDYLNQAGIKVRAAVYLRPEGGAGPTSLNAQVVGSFASAVKREMRRACNRYPTKLIHLFYFGPLGLAVILGQKLNGLPDIQCYERNKTTGYTPSCRLSG